MSLVWRSAIILGVGGAENVIGWLVVGLAVEEYGSGRVAGLAWCWWVASESMCVSMKGLTCLLAKVLVVLWNSTTTW